MRTVLDFEDRFDFVCELLIVTTHELTQGHRDDRAQQQSCGIVADH